jgi:hypothetical protein
MKRPSPAKTILRGDDLDETLKRVQPLLASMMFERRSCFVLRRSSTNGSRTDVVIFNIF